jgi:cation/acetate symporter
MPHVLTRYFTTPSVSQARRSVGWSLFFITLLYVAAPALAVLVKFEVLQHVVGLPFDELPAWVNRWSRLDPSLVSVRDVNGDGLLQFGELMMAGDVIVLAAPDIGGLPYWVTCLVAVGGMAAALSTADGLLLTVANAASHDVYYRVIQPGASAAARVIASKVLVMVIAFVAALIAALKITDILQFVSAAFSLAAAAFFPALVLGIFWRRANRAGASAGMLAGLGVCGWYMATNLPLLRAWFGITRPLADCQWWGVEPIAAGVFGVPVGFAVMVAVSLATAPPDEETMRFIDRIRLPQPGER